MRKNFLFSTMSVWTMLLLLLVIGAATADARDVEQARQAAMQQMKKRPTMRKPGQGAVVTVSPKLVYSKAKKGNDAYYYVFSAGDNNGFTMVSGDDRMPAIIGYTEKGDFNTDRLPDGLVDYMAAYQDFVDNATEKQIREVALWKTMASHEAVAPLMKEKWNQGEPYNGMCPMWGSQRCVTGCTATALAQILHYWECPEKLNSDIDAYTTKKNKISMSAISAGETYDWDNMLNVYTGSESQEQKDAVAKLMLHVGCAVNMDYSPNASGASANAEIFTKYFGMDKELVRDLSRANYSIADWDKILYGEMTAGRPVMYRGASTGGAHAFVIHGYSDGLYCVNWGWGGHCDGYFDITLLNPDSNTGTGASSSYDGYSQGNSMIIGIQPDNGIVDDVASSQLSCSSCSSEKMAVSNGNLTASVKLQMLSFNSIELSKYVSIGYVNDAGNIVNVGIAQIMNFQASNNGSSYYYYCTCPVSFPAENGKIYKLFAIESNDNMKWAKCNIYGYEDKYIALRMDGNKVETVELQSDLSASVALNSESGGFAGIQNTIDVTVTNKGLKEYYNVVYVYVSNTGTKPDGYSYATGITAAAEGGSTTFNFAYTPATAGTYNVWIYADDQKEIGTGTVEFGTSTAPVLSISSIKCTNASSETVYALYAGNSVQMNKVEDTKADFEFVIKNDGGYFDGDLAVCKYDKNKGKFFGYFQKFKIPGNSEQVFTFTVEGNAGDVVGVMLDGTNEASLTGLATPITHVLEGLGGFYLLDKSEIVYLAGVKELAVSEEVNELGFNKVTGTLNVYTKEQLNNHAKVIGFDLTDVKIDDNVGEIAVANPNTVFIVNRADASKIGNTKNVIRKAGAYLVATTPIEFTDGDGYPFYSNNESTNRWIDATEEGCTYTRVIPAQKWVSTCMITDAVIPEGIVAYTMDKVTTDGETRIALTKATAIEANKPYLVANTTSAPISITSSGYLNMFDDNGITVTDEVSGIKFVGLTKGITVQEGERIYAIGNVDYDATTEIITLNKVATGAKIGVARAFFQLDATTAQSKVSVIFDNGTTGINSVTTENVKNNKIYNINGQLVDNMNRKGIYIVNGKKVVK